MSNSKSSKQFKSVCALNVDKNISNTDLSNNFTNAYIPTYTIYRNSYFLQVELQGLTGKIQFDTLGFRSNFDLDIIELKKEGLVKVGSWSQEFGANFTRNFTESYTEIVESLHNKTLKITTILVRICGAGMILKSQI